MSNINTSMSLSNHKKQIYLNVAEAVILPIISIILSFIVIAIIVVILGEDPIEALTYLTIGVFYYSESIGYALYYSTNFIFTGLAVALAFKAGFFNIGGEGQAAVGGLLSAAMILALDHILPPYLLISLAFVAAFLGGALWALIPGYLQAWRGSHLVITTIMFNFIASALILWVILKFYVQPGNQAPETRVFNNINILSLQDVLAWIGIDIGKSPLNISFLFAIFVCIVIWFYLYRTVFGYEIRVLGKSENAANYSGINTKFTILTTVCISGGIAGLMSINEVIAVSGKYISGFTSGFGFVGIAVSLMGKNHPIGIIFAAILFGFLYQGGTELNIEMPSISREMVIVVQGLVILFAGALYNMLRPLVNKPLQIIIFGKDGSS